jgi:hypothetical protein
MIATPNRCVERRDPFEDPPSAMACAVQAQRVAELYLAEHPLFRLASWRCEQDRPREDPA